MSREHKEKALKNIRIHIAVVSTSRYRRMIEGGRVEDVSGELAVKLADRYGLKVSGKTIIPDDIETITKTVMERLKENDVIILVGGTGVSTSAMNIERRSFMTTRIEFTGPMVPSPWITRRRNRPSP